LPGTCLRSQEAVLLTAWGLSKRFGPVGTSGHLLTAGITLEQTVHLLKVFVFIGLLELLKQSLQLLLTLGGNLRSGFVLRRGGRILGGGGFLRPEPSGY
jgi:hypothetical protein